MEAPDVLKRLFEGHFEQEVDEAEAIQGELGASPRRIIRLRGRTLTAVGILYGVREENRAFLEFSRHFRALGLPVPEIYAEDLDHGAYLEEDLGDCTLYQVLSENRDGAEIAPAVIDAYSKVVELLPRFQVDGGRDLNYAVCYPRDSFDRQSITWDLNYFKYCFLRLANVEFNEQDLEDDFARLTDFLLGTDRQYFLYRDFQSRNVMLRGGAPYFLDYQGGRRGALQYDIASLLYDAKADLGPRIRERLLERYLDALSEHIALDRGAFMHHYYAYVYVRIMQALGAYGFRGLFEGKPLFVESIPCALGNVEWLLANVRLPFETPALMDAFRRAVASEELRASCARSVRQASEE